MRRSISMQYSMSMQRYKPMRRSMSLQLSIATSCQCDVAWCTKIHWSGDWSFAMSCSLSIKYFIAWRFEILWFGPKHQHAISLCPTFAIMSKDQTWLNSCICERMQSNKILVKETLIQCTSVHVYTHIYMYCVTKCVMDDHVWSSMSDVCDDS